MQLQTEFEFTLPKGFLDDRGNLHRDGAMRMATAMDEIAPLRDPRVRSNEAYLVILLLSQVITRLGPFRKVTPEMMESFFAADMAFLQDLYRQINEIDQRTVPTVCPNCGHAYEVDVPLLGES
ncbi:MAG: phage tail assembly protein [bacterium]|nr:phage tail assembly protein [bacterium]